MKKILPILVLSVVILSGCKKATPEVVQEVTTASETDVQKTKVEYQCSPGEKVYDLLDQQTEIEFNQTTFGKLISSIDGQEQGGGKYWLYSVDEKEATVGAEAYTCQGQEKILWELK